MLSLSQGLLFVFVVFVVIKKRLSQRLSYGYLKSYEVFFPDLATFVLSELLAKLILFEVGQEAAGAKLLVNTVVFNRLRLLHLIHFSRESYPCAPTVYFLFFLGLCQPLCHASSHSFALAKQRRGRSPYGNNSHPPTTNDNFPRRPSQAAEGSALCLTLRIHPA